MSSAKLAFTKPVLALVTPRSTPAALQHTPADIIRRAVSATGGRFGSFGGGINGVAFDPVTGMRITLEGIDLGGTKVDVFAVTLAGTNAPIFLDQILSRAERSALNRRVIAYLNAQEITANRQMLPDIANVTDELMEGVKV